MLSCRDKLILREIEKFEALTTKQIGRLFFPHNEHNYYYARVRMNALEKQGYVKSFINNSAKSNNKFYYIPLETSRQNTTVSQHKEKLVDFYTLLIFNGCKILDYKLNEYEWLDGKFRSDGIFIIEYNSIKDILVCEIDDTCSTKLKKYEIIFNSNQAHDKFGKFPWIFIVNSTGHKYTNQETKIDDYIVYLDFGFKDFHNKVLTKILADT